MDTLEEIEWCLDQLETLQTHQSVSDMASSKVSTSSPRTYMWGRTKCISIVMIFLGFDGVCAHPFHCCFCLKPSCVLPFDTVLADTEFVG